MSIIFVKCFFYFVNFELLVLFCHGLPRGVCQVLKPQDFMYLELYFVLLANHDQNNVFRSVLVQLKVVHLCKAGIELKQESIMPFGLARSIDAQARSIEARAECFSIEFSNSALGVLKRFQGFLFVLSIKGKPQPRFSVAHIAVCVNLL